MRGGRAMDIMVGMRPGTLVAARHLGTASTITAAATRRPDTERLPTTAMATVPGRVAIASAKGYSAAVAVRSGNAAPSAARSALSKPRSVINPVTNRAGVTSKHNSQPVTYPARSAPSRSDRRPSPGDVRHLVGAALLDRNLPDPVIDAEIDGRRRQRHVERQAVVIGGERLEIGADLVTDIAIGGHPVGATITRSTIPCCIR